MDGPTGEDLRRTWDANASFWARRLAEPDSWQQTLIYPAVERLLELRAGDRVLGLACGPGLLAQRMHAAGARVLATDFSEGMLELARERLAGLDVEVRALDATDLALLEQTGRFGAVVCCMGLMDIADVAPLAAALPAMLEPGGRFVFAVTHPVFNSMSSVLVTERHQDGSELRTEHSIRVRRYSSSVGTGVGIPDQPSPQWSFDRPIAELLGPFFGSGLRLDALEEPKPVEPETAAWREFPPVLVDRFRPN